MSYMLRGFAVAAGQMIGAGQITRHLTKAGFRTVSHDKLTLAIAPLVEGLAGLQTHKVNSYAHKLREQESPHILLVAPLPVFAGLSVSIPYRVNDSSENVTASCCHARPKSVLAA